MKLGQAVLQGREGFFRGVGHAEEVAILGSHGAGLDEGFEVDDALLARLNQAAGLDIDEKAKKFAGLFCGE